MTTAGEMVMKTAQVFGVNPVTLESIDRALLNAGLRNKGGRGRSAAQMVGLDICNLALAAVHGVGMKEAPALVAKVSGLPRHLSRLRRQPASDSILDRLAEGTDWAFPQWHDDFSQLPLGQELMRAATLGSAMGVLVDGLAAGALNNEDHHKITVKITNNDPFARLHYEANRMELEVRYGLPDANLPAPAFQMALTLTTDLFEQLADIIRGT
ncbi:hypothetical protein EOK75_00580 [Pseudorhodobacter turbinis]|uniref:Uncharacterized protein n=1 Tax=Pseudorhodobacter turbinis TaxID=2500533 RepID=A0A4P8EDK1_9RHOB|nr:hypothetical protein [Pseudorhodobacter turbinis]QCO54445.1 hypothetical protein EOK75_00580 [Pseudorhodobacter turbinis]